MSVFIVNKQEKKMIDALPRKEGLMSLALHALCGRRRKMKKTLHESSDFPGFCVVKCKKCQ